MIEPSLVISTISIIMVVITFFYNQRKDTKADVNADNSKYDVVKESVLKANMKLDQICATTNETRTDIKAMDSRISSMETSLALVKRDLETAFMRIDENREAITNLQKEE